jgi:hypothetical protein
VRIVTTCIASIHPSATMSPLKYSTC